MNRNERTPRTLADCQWRTGYRCAEVQQPSRWPSIALAVFIGASLALTLVYGGWR